MTQIYNQSWFKAVESNPQPIPFNNNPTTLDNNFHPLVPRANRLLKYLDVLDNFIVSSNGWMIDVDKSIPGWFKQENFDEYILAAEYDNAKFYLGQNDENLQLKYKVCNYHNNLKQTLQHEVYADVESWNMNPDPRMIKNPIWSTWAKFRMPVSQNDTINYANDILKFWEPACVDHSCGQIEIDDKWQINYGDLEFDFDENKFPQPKQMVDDLHANNFTVTIWTTPFVNRDAKIYSEVQNQEYYVKNSNGDHNSHIHWWQCGINPLKERDFRCGYILDFTNPKVYDWQKSRFERLKTKYGIDGFKFDAGEEDYFPENFKLYDENIWSFGQYTTKYAEFCNEFGGNGEMRAAYNQKEIYSGWTRFLDLSSSWSEFNGLRSIIPKALTFSLAGYPWIMSDMIGGNVGGVLFDLEVPEPELFIRWTQLAMFMPTVQFSLTPWEDPYLNEFASYQVAENAINFAKLRNKYVTPIILGFQANKSKIGQPKFGFPVTPVWWLENSDPEIMQKLYQVSDEYMVGTSILVVPIDQENTQSRTVYFPGDKSTTWHKIDCFTHEITDTVFAGGSIIENYQIGLYEIGLFININ